MTKSGVVSQMEAAHRALKSCRVLLRERDCTGACNRAYYAMFYAAHAALQSAGVIRAGTVYKTHSGLVGAFGKELVVTGKLSSKLSSSFSKVLNVRLIADYNGDPVDEADAEWAAGEAETFVAAIEFALPKLRSAEP